jgi:uncharacterized protein (DUF111 family)
VVKNSQDQVISFKPEFEDIKIIAARIQIPVRRVMELVSVQIAQKTGGMQP